MLAKPPRGSLLLPGHPINRGLVLSLPMNEGAGGKVLDASGNGRTGTITEATWTAGKLDFDGTGDVIHFPQALNEQLHGTSAITMVLWFRADVVPASDYTYIAEAVCDGTKAGWGLTFSSGEVEVVARSSTADSLQYEGFAFTDTTEWHHLVGVIDYTGSRLLAYLDGVEKFDVAKTFSSGTYVVGSPSRVPALGGRASDRYSDMVISSFSIYSRALTPSEIQRLYRDPWQGFQQDPIELWTAATSGAVSGDITVEPSALALQLSLNAPTVNWDYLLSVAAQSLVVGLPTPDVSGEVNITVAPDALNLALSIQTPTWTYDYVVSPDALALLLGQQSVTTAYDYTISPDALSLLLGLPEPTTSGAVNITITPDALSLVLGLQAPTTTYDYQVALGSALALAAALNEPTAGTGITVSVDAQGLTVSLQTPTTLYDYLVSVDAQSLELSVQEPSTLFDFVHEVAAALGMTATLYAPTVSGSTGRTYIVCSSTDPAQLDFYIGGTLVARFT